MKIRLLVVLFISILVCHNALAASDQISIASFNIQIFGKTKANKQDVLLDIVKIMKSYDVIAVQEIRDKTSESITKLRDALNADGEEYKYVIGPRVGRSSSKEQYDFNADCTYYNENSNNAFTSSDYTWLITNDMDTNVADTSCTYDRIVITGSVKEDYANKGGVYRYEDDLGLNRSQVKAISDHYPVYSYFYTNKDTD